MVQKLESMIGAVGKAVSWLSLGLVLVIVVDVCLRYFFSLTSAASFELEWHLFAVLFLLSAAWALQEDKHVRVDLFYQHFSARNQAWVNLLGTVFFLWPFSIIAGYESLSMVAASFALAETSNDPGGLPARYLIKSAIPISFALLALQGLAMVAKSIVTLKASLQNENQV